jgi:anaerobic magnesium-protoporphyrin IX monomethyl ester cyclase
MLILYNPPSSQNRKPVLPMSLLALGALLEGTEEYLIVDGNLEADPLAALDRAIGGRGADILGVTVMPGPQLISAAPLCRTLKERHPGLTVVWGGYFPSQHHEACLRSGYVDYVVRGHGEVTFHRLVEALRQGEDPKTLPGLAFLDPSSGEPETNPMDAVPHPDRLPDFPYHRVEVARYLRPTFMGSRTMSHQSSYGCPFSCSFCAVVNMTQSRWLAQSADRTARVARDLVRRWGADSLEFYDNNFFVHEARTAEFAEKVSDLGIAWWGEARVDTLLDYSEATWRAMRDSGLRMVFMGAESGSEETLMRMNKGGTASTDKTLALVERMRRYGIVPELSFVVGNPPDPEDDARRTLEFIRRVKAVNPASEIVLYMYAPVPLAGELYQSARDCGFRFPETLEGWLSRDWQQFSQRRGARLPWVGDPLRARIQDFERVLNARYPTVTNPRLQGWRRGLLRASAAWRYRLRIYSLPLELRILQRLLGYRRPETSGF